MRAHDLDFAQMLEKLLRYEPRPTDGASRTMSLNELTRRFRRLTSKLRARSWATFHRGIEVGRGARVGRGCRLLIDRGARLRLGQGCEIDDGTTIAVYANARIVLGAGSFVGHHATIAACESVQVGNGVFVADMVSIRDHDHEVGRSPSSGAMTITPVVVGDDVWIGSKATLLRGADVGAGAIVGANAVVRGSVPARSVVAGVPARVIRMLES
jgi:acetyltransferase-like isoleucine patch superfamily enzyme